MEDPKLLSDDQLLGRLEAFVEAERERLHTFLAWLGEADSRKLPEDRGYSSTFDFCVRHLKLSEDEAYRRIHAARAAVVRPELLSALADGNLSLTAVSLIAPHVHRPDAPAIIARVEGKSRRQIDDILAPLRPEQDRRDTIRSVATRSAESSFNAPVPVVRVDFSFRGSSALRDAIDRIKELLSHKYPGGALEDVLLEVAQDYLTRHDPQKGLPGRLAPVKGSSAISAPVRRAVWGRDGARCAYVGSTGTRCIARRFLEIDHIKPRTLGGDDSLGNLRLLCRAHNDSERRRILGEGGATSALSSPAAPLVPSGGMPGTLGSLSDRRRPYPRIRGCASP